MDWLPVVSQIQILQSNSIPFMSTIPCKLFSFQLFYKYYSSSLHSLKKCKSVFVNSKLGNNKRGNTDGGFKIYQSRKRKYCTVTSYKITALSQACNMIQLILFLVVIKIIEISQFLLTSVFSWNKDNKMFYDKSFEKSEKKLVN